jgi:hypothetical protein
MNLNEYIKENINSFEIIGDSTNKVYAFDYFGSEYILKKCNMDENNLSVFWQYMNHVFGHTFYNFINNLPVLHKYLANEIIPIAGPVFIDTSLKSHVYEKISGSCYSPDMFPDNKDIHFQLGKYIGYIQKQEYEYYGTIYNHNKDSFENAIYSFSENIIKKYWTNRKDIKYHFDGVFKDKAVFNRFSLIMPDISANQFIYSHDLEKINGVIDLDAYIIGPKELELTILELCIPNIECADYFKKGYELFNKLPILKNYRKIFRFISYLCDLEQIENIEKFMEKNIYFE